MQDPTRSWPRPPLSAVIRGARPVLTPPETIGDDAALLAAARLDPEAFGALYERYLPRIYAYLRTRCGSDEDAADMAQEVFERALAALPRYRERGLPFAAWLFAITRNRAIDAARRSRSTGRQQPMTDDLLASSGPEVAFLRSEALAASPR